MAHGVSADSISTQRYASGARFTNIVVRHVVKLS